MPPNYGHPIIGKTRTGKTFLTESLLRTWLKELAEEARNFVPDDAIDVTSREKNDNNSNPNNNGNPAMLVSNQIALPPGN